MAEIDFSDEGLEARLVDAETGEPATPPTDDPAKVEAASGEAEPVADGEPPVEEAPAAETDSAESNAPAPQPAIDWEARYRNAEQALGRQGQELGQLRQMVELMQQAQQSADDPYRLPYGAPETMDDLLDLAVQNPDEAFAFALDHAPDTVPHVIAEVRQVDPALAEEMALHIAEMRAEGRVREIEQRVEQQVQPLTTMQQVNAQRSAVDNVITARPDFAEMGEEIARIVQTEPGLFKSADPQHIAEGVDKAYWMAKAARADALLRAQQVQQTQLSAGAAQAAVVNEGTPAQTPEPPDTTVEDDIRAGIFEANKKVTW